MAYREIIPLRAVVESLDLFEDRLERRVCSHLDMFAKIARGAESGGSVILCYLEDLTPPMLRPAALGSFPLKVAEQSGVIGDIQVLTRLSVCEIRAISGLNPYTLTLHCVMLGPRGVRDITLYFFSQEHRSLFEFALQQLHLPEYPTLFTPEANIDILRARVLYARDHHSVPFGDFIHDLLSEGWNSVDWGLDDNLIRAIHPFFNVQVVWISSPSPALRDWLEDVELQRHFFMGFRESGSDSGGTVVSSIHRTPIDASIDAGMYGWGSWLRPDNEQDLMDA